MKSRQPRNRILSLPAGSLAFCLLSAGVVASTTPSQDGGGKQQGGTPETMPVKPREAPAAQSDLAGELGRLQEQFNERLRSTLRSADAGSHGKPIADELIVTMFGDDRIMAGYPVAGGSTTNTGRGADAGGSNRPGNAAAAQGQGELLGVLVIAGTRGAGDTPGTAGEADLGAGVFEVWLVGGNTLALMNDAGTALRRIPFHHGPAVRRVGGTTPGGAEGSGGRPRENPGTNPPPGSNPAGPNPETPAAGGRGDARPEWSKVFLAIVTDLAPTLNGQGGATR